jgi:hypothetical protein
MAEIKKNLGYGKENKMSFYSKWDSTIRKYVIKWHSVPDTSELLNADPGLRILVGTQFPLSEKPESVVDALNEALRQFKTVIIVPFCRKNVGDGSVCYAVQRVFDRAYLDIFNQFVRGNPQEGTTAFFSTEDKAETTAGGVLGYNPKKL